MGQNIFEVGVGSVVIIRVDIFILCMVGETLHDAGIDGDEYWQRYWMEIDKNWFAKFKESPPVMATYLRRDFMDELRKEIGKQRQPNRPKNRQPATRNKPR